MNDFEIEVELVDDEYEIEVDLEDDISEIYIYDYGKITNKPKINNVELVGNKTFKDFGLRPMTNTEIENLFKIGKEKI